MLVIPDFLTPDEIGEIDRLMDSAPYDDGHHTATGQARRVKGNRQVSRSWAGIAALDAVIERAIRRSRPLIEEVSPCAHSQPLYVRYEPGAAYGAHIDAVLSGMPPIRQDVSMTVCLTALVYQTGIVHEVTAVERGERRAVALWLQSYYRDSEIRGVIAELRRCVEAVRAMPGGDPLPLVKVLTMLERRFIAT
jgi:PKHD-type hydroxylase